MAALVVVVVDVVAEFEAGLSQAEKAAAVEQFGFEPALEELGLGVVVAAAASALRAHGLVILPQLPISVAAVLPAATRVGPVAVGQRPMHDIADLQGRGGTALPATGPLLQPALQLAGSAAWPPAR